MTPNIPEAEVLTNKKIKNLSDMIIAGKILLKLGVKNVLIKGVIVNLIIFRYFFESKKI